MCVGGGERNKTGIYVPKHAYKQLHVPQITDVTGKVSCPQLFKKAKGLLHEHLHGSMMVRATEIPDLTFTCTVPLNLEIKQVLNHHIIYVMQKVCI